VFYLTAARHGGSRLTGYKVACLTIHGLCAIQHFLKFLKAIFFIGVLTQCKQSFYQTVIFLSSLPRSELPVQSPIQGMDQNGIVVFLPRMTMTQWPEMIYYRCMARLLRRRLPCHTKVQLT
jgi:hypothetical protein